MEYSTYDVLQIIFYWAPFIYINLFVLRFSFKKAFTNEGLFVPAALTIQLIYCVIALIPLLNFILMFTITDEPYETKKE